jgi:GTPase SAR1 family protein
MGKVGSRIESQQILIVGLEKSGKSLFLKKLVEMKRKQTDDVNIETTIGYNYVNIIYSGVSCDVWDLGGDPISKSYWPTFYRNLKFSTVLFIIDIFSRDTLNLALKELLTLLNEEELKQARFFIIFNVLEDNTQKNLLSDLDKKEVNELCNDLINTLKECPIHDYETRVFNYILDISKMKEGETKTEDLLYNCLNIKTKDKNNNNNNI